MSKPIKVYTPPGIGDSLWSLMYVFNNTDRPIDLYTWKRSNVSSPFMKGLKPVKNVYQFDKPWRSYNQFTTDIKKHLPTYRSLKDLNNVDEIYLETNTFIENYNRLEDYITNLNIDFDNFPWEVKDDDLSLMDTLVNDRTIILYTASLNINTIKNSDNIYNNWNEFKWVEIFKAIRSNFSNSKIIWIGADFDKLILSKLKDKNVYPDEVYLNQSSSFIISLFRRAPCAITFQSGMSILSVYEKCPTYMLYFNWLAGLMNSWVPEGCLNNKDLYFPLHFDQFDPQELIDWLKIHIK